MAKENLIQVVSAEKANRTLTQHGLNNALWLIVSQQMNHRVVMKRGLINHGIPRDAVLKVEYHGADDVYVITAARQQPRSDIISPN